MSKTGVRQQASRQRGDGMIATSFGLGQIQASQPGPILRASIDEGRLAFTSSLAKRVVANVSKAW
jgi:hypothetical protein